MFALWCQQTAELVRQQINKRKTRISLFMANDSEENYCYLLDGTVKFTVEKQFGYEFFFLEVYEDYEQFVKHPASLLDHLLIDNNHTNSCNTHQLQITPQHPPIIKKMILPQCLFQINLTQLKIYLLQSQTHSRTAMLRFQNQQETEIYWKFICWVIKREENMDYDPSKALYLPNQKNISFIVKNFDSMKHKVNLDIKSNQLRFMDHLQKTIEKCIQVGDYHNLQVAHELIEKVLYCEDNALIELLFRDDSSFELIMGSFSRKRCQDLLSCYWDPILPLPLQREYELSSVVTQDFLQVVPLQVRESICIIHRITFFREFVLEIKKRSAFEAKLMEIMKHNNSLLIRYFTNDEIVKDLLIYDEQKWGLWKSQLKLRNDDSSQCRSAVFLSYSLDEDRQSIKYASKWERMSVRSSITQKQANSPIEITDDKVIYMDLQQHHQQTTQNILEQSQPKQSHHHQQTQSPIITEQCIEIQDDSSGCQIIQQNQKHDKTITIENQNQNQRKHIEVDMENGAIVVEGQINREYIRNTKDIPKQINENQKKVFVEEQIMQSHRKLIKSFKPLLFWLIVTFAKNVQQPQIKQQSIAALFQSDLLKYVFKHLNRSLAQAHKLQNINSQKQQHIGPLQSTKSKNNHNPTITTSSLMIKSDLYLQILISMAKYNHKRMIAYMNNCMRRANLNEMAIKMSQLKNNNGKREWKKAKQREINLYKILALSYWKWMPIDDGAQEEYKKILFFFQNLLPQMCTEMHVETFLTQFMGPCLQSSTRYLSKDKIKKETHNQKISQNHISKNPKQQQNSLVIPLLEARRRQLELCLFVMRNISFGRYGQFIRDYLLKYILSSFENLQNEFGRYSKQDKLLLFQIVNKCIEWIEVSRKEREKHDRREHELNTMVGYGQEDECSDFNVPYGQPWVSTYSIGGMNGSNSGISNNNNGNNKYAHQNSNVNINSSNSINFAKKNIQQPSQIHTNPSAIINHSNQAQTKPQMKQNSVPQMRSGQLLVLEQAIQKLQEALVHAKIVDLVIISVLGLLKKRKENCLVGCGLQVMKKLITLIPSKYKSVITIKNSSISNGDTLSTISNVNTQNTTSNNFNITLLYYQQQPYTHNMPTNKSNYHHPFTLNGNKYNKINNISPLMKHVFGLLQSNPQWEEDIIKRVPAKYQQLFMAFHPSILKRVQQLQRQLQLRRQQQLLKLHQFESNLQLSSSQVQSSSVDYSQSNESQMSHQYQHRYRRYRERSNQSYGWSNSSNDDDSDNNDINNQQEWRKEIVKRHLEVEGIIDEMYNRRQQSQSESEEGQQSSSEQDQSDQQDIQEEEQGEQQCQEGQNEGLYHRSLYQGDNQDTFGYLQNNDNNRKDGTDNANSMSDCMQRVDRVIELLNRRHSTHTHQHKQTNNNQIPNELITSSAQEKANNITIDRSHQPQQNTNGSSQQIFSPINKTHQDQTINGHNQNHNRNINSKNKSSYHTRTEQQRQNQQQALCQKQVCTEQKHQHQQDQQEKNRNYLRSYYHENSTYRLHQLLEEQHEETVKCNRTGIELETIAEQEMTLEAFTSYQPTKMHHNHRHYEGNNYALSPNKSHFQSNTLTDNNSTISPELINPSLINNSQRIIYKVDSSRYQLHSESNNELNHFEQNQPTKCNANQIQPYYPINSPVHLTPIPLQHQPQTIKIPSYNPKTSTLDRSPILIVTEIEQQCKIQRIT